MEIICEHTLPLDETRTIGFLSSSAKPQKGCEEEDLVPVECCSRDLGHKCQKNADLKHTHTHMQLTNSELPEPFIWCQSCLLRTRVFSQSPANTLFQETEDGYVDDNGATDELEPHVVRRRREAQHRRLSKQFLCGPDAETNKDLLYMLRLSLEPEILLMNRLMASNAKRRDWRAMQEASTTGVKNLQSV